MFGGKELYPDDYSPDEKSDTTVICPICGEELTLDDCVYINAEKEVIGCSQCVKIVGVERFDKA